MGIDYEKYIQEFAETYKLDKKYERMSSKELQRLVLDSAQKVLVTDDTTELIKLNAIARVCKEIINERAEILEKVEKDKEEWEKNKVNEVNEAIIEMKSVYSPNAQLMMSILEECGEMTKEDIVNWCPEFQMMEDDEISSLLFDLEKYHIIQLEDNKYKLINVVYNTPYKFPWKGNDVQQYILDILDHPEENGSYTWAQLYSVVIAMFFRDEPFTRYELKNEIKKLLTDTELMEEYQLNQYPKFIEDLNEHITRYDSLGESNNEVDYEFGRSGTYALRKQGVIEYISFYCLYYPLLTKKVEGGL